MLLATLSFVLVTLFVLQLAEFTLAQMPSYAQISAALPCATFTRTHSVRTKEGFF
jgi:hypothetical protein